MNPYSRFGVVSNTASAAIIIGSLVALGPLTWPVVEASISSNSTMAIAALAGAVTVMVVFWMALTEAIFPVLFRFNTVRRMILGKYYFEGTWLQSEKGEDHKRLSVIDIQPAGKSFIFSGYSLDENLQIESNSLIEFSKMTWPFMTYKYRNSLSDGTDGKRDGIGELQFEMNRAAAQRYNGFVQYMRSQSRLRIEGAKLTSNSEVKNLRTLHGRQKVFQKYWELFFNSSVHGATRPQNKPSTKTVEKPAEPAKASTDDLDRRKSETPSANKDGVVPRRRVSDWSEEPELEKRDVVIESKETIAVKKQSF